MKNLMSINVLMAEKYVLKRIIPLCVLKGSTWRLVRWLLSLNVYCCWVGMKISYIIFFKYFTLK